MRIIIILFFICGMTHASNLDFDASQVQSVEKIIEITLGSEYEGTCIDLTTGKIALEEDNLCGFSDENEKSQCNAIEVWRINDVASFICSNIDG